MYSHGTNRYKNELEGQLGHPISESVFEKCVEAYHCARRAPAGLGGYATLGYSESFQRVMGDECEAGMYRFFCGRDDSGERIRKLLIPYQFNLEFMSKELELAYRETYNNEPYYCFCEWWYERFIWYFLKSGMSEGDVAVIIRKYKIPVQLVKESGSTSELEPETVALNVLGIWHDSVNLKD